MARLLDIAVLGATPAGYVAAMILARKGHDAAVVDAPAAATESPLADWVPAELFRTCPPLKAVKSAGTDAAFRAVRFHGPELASEAAYRHRGVAGYVLHRATLVRALERAAGKAGVRRVRSAERVTPELEEASVRLPARRPVRARLLLLAQDGPVEAMAALGLPARAAPTGRLRLWGVNVPLSGPQRRRVGPDMHIVAFEGGERLGMYFAAGADLHVRIIAGRQEPPGVAEEEPSPAEGDADALGRLIARLQWAGLLPERLSLRRAKAAAWYPPGGAALEMETHLAKRTLLVGTAGGFAADLSGQTLDPTVRSARVAADVAGRALRSTGVQDALADYKKRWRDPLADRIRHTGTSLKMLMPMVLSNRTMTRRFARALLYGENL